VNNILKAISYPTKVSKEFELLMLNKIDYENKKHIIEHRIDLIRCFNPKTIDTTLDIPKKFNLKKNKNSNILCFQLAAADRYKMWPIERFVKLTDKIIEDLKGDCKIVLLGVKSEANLAKTLKNSSKYNNLIENLCGKTKIEELPLVLQRSNLLITNDTGTLHLSIALKVPSISLFSPTECEVFGPYQDLDIHKTIQKDGSFINKKPKKLRTDEAMKLITVDEVFEVYRQIKNKVFKCAE
jgi:ADP-heptose:LPS heptosyltransferase